MIKITKILFTVLALIALTINVNAQFLSEDFENGGAIPTGWTNETTDDADWNFATEDGFMPGFDNYIDHDHTTGSGYFAAFNPSDNGDVALLTSPSIDLSNAVAAQLKFWRIRPFDGYDPKLEVNIYANGEWNNNLISGLADTTTVWKEVIFDLSDYKYDDVKIQFKGVYDYRVIGIDDVSVEGQVGINDINNVSINLYPNPTTGVINIENSDNSLITVFNILGEAVTIIENAPATTKIDISNQPVGAYFVKVESNNNVITKKVVLTR